MWSMNLLFVTEYYCIVLDGLFGTASVGCRTNGVKECWRKGYKVLDRGALWAVKLKQMIGVLYSRRSNKIQSREKSQLMQDSEFIGQDLAMSTLKGFNRHTFLKETAIAGIGLQSLGESYDLQRLASLFQTGH